ncbi:hypothetical protein EVAR_103039_1 [Eumeta japonica]|uniref:Integrase catalytic domain-containing protein n=1 Tax=Eumeta variegata TaxID=151549 RepID=A0A4C1WES7_EUMVA|nr:hypothetical protein EVAR_103039_1 [Eumeta japonica]
MKLDVPLIQPSNVTDSPASPDPALIQDKVKIGTSARDKAANAKATGVKSVAPPKAKPPFDSIKITVPSIQDHRNLTRLLINDKIPFHNHPLDEERKIKVVIRAAYVFVRFRSSSSPSVRASYSRTVHIHVKRTLDRATWSDRAAADTASDERSRPPTAILLGTTLMDTIDNYGNIHTLRVLVDSASQKGLITAACCKTLNLQLHPPRSKVVAGVGHLTNPVEGSDLFEDILRPNIVSRFPGELVAIETLLGYVILGEAPTIVKPAISEIHTFCTYDYDSLNDCLNRFFELEDVPEAPLLTFDESECETIYCETTRRNKSGCYSVARPFKSDVSALGNRARAAQRRYYSSERKLLVNSSIKREHDNVYYQYLDKGYLVSLTKEFKNDPSSQYVIPHHAVYRSDKFTKLRVVLDANYAGPLHILPYRRRDVRSTKSYICLFICLVTKAVHIELASDLITDFFLSAFKRFLSRRGPVGVLYSDCGTNFVGAKSYLDNLYKLLSLEEYNNRFANELRDKRIEWKLNPPSAPHFGGMCGSNVRYIKIHLLRVVGSQLLTYEEMIVVLVQIEAILKSRPLSAMSCDPSEPLALTPAHFLTLTPLTFLPARDFSHQNINLLQRKRIIDHFVQSLWRRW